VILLFGAGGQLGRELTARANALGEPLVALSRQDADISDPPAIARALDRAKATMVVNAAAYTKVDQAESEPEAAFAANETGAVVLAEACARAGLPLVHISTDYVFDGSKAGAYVEDDAVAPLGVYGRSKLAGEQAVRERNPRHVILRTAWVYGAYGQNFLKTMLRLAAERDELRVVADQRGSPTATADIAEAILHVGRKLRDAPWGTYHFAGSGETSWHGFAAHIVAAQAPFTGRRPPVTAIATADFPTKATRPRNSVLDSSRFATVFGYKAEPWDVATDRTVGQILSGGLR
jgi:dTDP-4-dehydrorhamnose reductase